MSREGRGLIVSIFKDFINSLKPRQFKAKLVGKDYCGNHYYEIPSNRARASRYYVPKGGDESKFDEGLPAEWESWLRFRRKTAPTEEEIAKNVTMMKMRKENALKIEEKYKSKVVQQHGSTKSSTSYPQYEEYELFPGKQPNGKT